MLELFPETAAIDDGELAIGGIRTSTLASEFGTPLVVYDASTLTGAARAYRAAAPEARIVYGAKAFANVAIMRLLAAEGIGADVSTLGELQLALHAGLQGDQLVVHGNNKSDEELDAAARAGAAFVVVDSLDEVERAAGAGIQRILVRVTPGVEADTHPAIRTAHEGSKFGLPPEQAIDALARARDGRARRRRASRPHRLATPRHEGRADDGRLGRRVCGEMPRRARLDTVGDRPRRRPRDPVRGGPNRALDRDCSSASSRAVSRMSGSSTVSHSRSSYSSLVGRSSAARA